MLIKVLAVVLLVSTWSYAQQLKNLNQMLAWKTLEYGFHSDVERQYAVDNGLLKSNTGTPIDVAVEYMHQGHMRVFTTIPRFSKGIPYSLATISSRAGDNGPIIYPYPSYDTHIVNNAECEGITSAFRVAIDDCQQMWVIDSGVVENLQICPPQLLTFDLRTDRLINRYQFPTHLYTPAKSLLINLVVDTFDPPPRGRCQEAMVYIADVRKPGLLVYDSTLNEAWRVENKLLLPDPAFGTHTVGGESFTLMDGVFSLNLTPRNKKGKNLDLDPRIINRRPMSTAGPPSDDRYLYFHALASDTENCVPLRVLNDKSAWEQNINAYPEEFELLGHRGIQAAMEAIDSRGNIFANTEDPLTVFAWNIYNSPYTQSSFKVVANNPEQLQFASGMKVVRNLNGEEELWMTTCKLQKLFGGSGMVNANEINYRILACKIDDLLAGRQCSGLQTQVKPHSETLFTNLILQ